jgi:hypothetical protein
LTACSTATTSAIAQCGIDLMAFDQPAGSPSASDYPKPFPIQPRGSGLAALGWTVHFDGLPAQQGVLVVYPHTSNWDFVILLLAKWALGLEVRFWGKDKLFGIPLFGRWLRWLGGVPVDRLAPQGAVGQMIDIMREQKAENNFFWLALAPEGTRRSRPGWRSGFYRVAVQANVPLGLVRADYGRREVEVVDFLRLSGDEAADMARIAAAYQGSQGLRPEHASPVRLLGNEANQNRSDST